MPPPWVCLFDINYKLRKATRVHDDVCGLCCCLRPFWWPWSVLPPRAMLMSVTCAAAGSCIDVHRPCLCCTSCWSLCSMLALGIHVEGWKRWCDCPWSKLLWLFGQWSFFCSSINNCKVIIENERISRLLWQPPLSNPSKKRNSPERKSLKRFLENCDEDSEAYSSQLMPLAREWGRTQISLRDWPLRIWPCSMSIWATKIGFAVFFKLTGEGRTRVRRWTLEKWEVSAIRMHCMKFPNNQKKLCWAKNAVKWYLILPPHTHNKERKCLMESFWHFHS